LISGTHASKQRLGVEFNSKLVYEECSMCEISNLCKDFINLGFIKFMVVPRVKVAYDLKIYQMVRESYDIQKTFSKEESQAITFLPLPETQDCQPLDINGTCCPDPTKYGKEILKSKVSCRLNKIIKI